MKTFFRFIFSKLFLKQLIVAILISLAIFVTTLITLKVFTRHGKSIQIPDITGYNEAQVERIISEKELRYEIIDSVYTQDVLKGTVYDQIPAAGSFVKKNRKIFIITNAKNQEMVSMPSLENESLRQAKVLIEQRGLKLGRIIYIPSEYKDLILKQLMNGKIIKAGTMIPKWSEIDLNVGKGMGSDEVPTPYLRGTYWINAKELITKYGLNEGAITYDETILPTSNLDSAIVWKQNPQPYVAARTGKSIDTWLTMDINVVYAADSSLIPVTPEYGNDIDIDNNLKLK